MSKRTRSRVQPPALGDDEMVEIPCRIIDQTADGIMIAIPGSLEERASKPDRPAPHPIEIDGMGAWPMWKLKRYLEEGHRAFVDGIDDVTGRPDGGRMGMVFALRAMIAIVAKVLPDDVHLVEPAEALRDALWDSTMGLGLHPAFQVAREPAQPGTDAHNHAQVKLKAVCVVASEATMKPGQDAARNCSRVEADRTVGRRVESAARALGLSSSSIRSWRSKANSERDMWYRAQAERYLGVYLRHFHGDYPKAVEALLSTVAPRNQASRGAPKT
jgi:hypothetical protein